MLNRLYFSQLAFSFLDIMGAATGTSQAVIGAESAKTQLSGFPTLKPAFNLKIDVNATAPGGVGPTSAGSELVHWICPSGKLTTVEGFEPKIEADVIFGADWLYFDNDKQFARPNVKAVAKTPEGQTLTIEYDGIATLAQEFVDIFAGKPDAKTIPFGLSVTEHRFQAGAPELKFLENHKWIGNGRIVVGEDAEGGRTVTVESRISQVVPSTVMD